MIYYQERGEGGELEEVENLPNNRIVDNQYQKMVDQKKNYLLGQPFSIQTKNEAYAKLLLSCPHLYLHPNGTRENSPD